MRPKNDSSFCSITSLILKMTLIISWPIAFENITIITSTWHYTIYCQNIHSIKFKLVPYVPGNNICCAQQNRINITILDNPELTIIQNVCTVHISQRSEYKMSIDHFRWLQIISNSFKSRDLPPRYTYIAFIRTTQPCKTLRLKYILNNWFEVKVKFLLHFPYE